MSDKAAPESEKKEESAPPPKKSGTPVSVRFAIFALCVAALMLLPSTVVLSVCLIPTLVAAIVDNHGKKTAWLTIGALNLAGAVPPWFRLWDMGHTMSAAFQLAFEPMTILMAYGGAAIGWFFYNNVTPFVASIVVGKNERRLRDIDRQQRELVRKWGEGVAAG